MASTCDCYPKSVAIPSFTIAACITFDLLSETVTHYYILRVLVFIRYVHLCGAYVLDRLRLIRTRIQRLFTPYFTPIQLFLISLFLFVHFSFYKHP